ncbi:MAG: hypothetical protein PHH40_04625 [Candidatus Moranbacteria bacterium]|nr:hypothetical protein [Candidatus Moranbacteria bacterium]MDD3964480.1 hypothetical protein [Candidatus Moranbacteria bacterium]
MTEEKKTVRAKKSVETSFMEFLLDTAVQNIRSLVDGALDTVRQTAEKFTYNVTKQIMLFCLALIGVIFFLVGCAQILSDLFRFPGLGFIIIGISVLMFVATTYFLNRK